MRQVFSAFYGSDEADYLNNFVKFLNDWKKNDAEFYFQIIQKLNYDEDLKFDTFLLQNKLKLPDTEPEMIPYFSSISE